MVVARTAASQRLRLLPDTGENRGSLLFGFPVVLERRSFVTLLAAAA